MRAFCVVLSSLVLCAWAAGCGGNGVRTGSHDHQASHAPSVAAVPVAETGPQGRGGYLKSDGDTDGDDRSTHPSDDDEQEMVLASRHLAKSDDRRALAATVKRYYAAASSEDGAKGCSMLTPRLASSVAEEQPQVAPRAARTCAAVLSRLFMRQHQYLASEDFRTMVVTGVHVNGAVGFVTLGFKAARESEMVAQREGGIWKLNALFDSTLP